MRLMFLHSMNSHLKIAWLYYEHLVIVLSVIPDGQIL